MTTGTQAEIQHDAAGNRYFVAIDGTEAYLTYETPRPGHRHITHTIVADALSGRGLGKVLVTRILEDIIAAGETVSSSCWFASSLIDKTPDWSRLRA